MRRLLPALEDGRRSDDVSGDDALADAYEYPDPANGRPVLRANMVGSLDGRAALHGRSGGLSGPADKRVFATLRALADAIVVGAGTLRIEGYGPARPRPEYAERRRAAGQAPAATLVVVSRSLRLDLDGPAFTDATARTIVLTAASAPADRLVATRQRADVLVVGDDVVDVVAAVDALGERGLVRLLCEGGPTLLAQVIATGRLDELCMTFAPLLAGGSELRLTAETPLFDNAGPMSLTGLLEEDGWLFARYGAG